MQHRTLVCLPTVIVVISASTAMHAQSIDARLRQSLKLPVSLHQRLMNSVGIGYSRTEGFCMTLGADQAEAPQIVVALRRSMGSRVAHPAMASIQNTPADAWRYEQIGYYEEEIGDGTAAGDAYVKAEKLYKIAAERDILIPPLHSNGLIGYARVLCRLGWSDEAANVLQFALRHDALASGRSTTPEWRLWDALADCFATKAEHLAQAAASGDRSPDILRLLNEAQTDFDHSIRVAPTQGIAYAERGEFLRSTRPDTMDRLAGRSPDILPNVPPAALADFEQAARLLPNDAYATGAVIWMRLAPLGMRKLGLPFPSQAAWRAMPPSFRSASLVVIRRLTVLSQSRDRQTADQASIVLGFLLYETQRDVGAAKQALYRAMHGKTEREATELLIHITGLEGRFAEMDKICRWENYRHPTARLHLIAAYAALKLADPNRAVYEVDKALRFEPGDPVDLLTLATIYMKWYANPSWLKRAQSALTAAASRAEDPIVAEDDHVCHGVMLALSGKANPGRAELKVVLSKDPNNTTAKAAWDVLKPKQL